MQIDFDEDRPLGEQLKEALTKHAIRVLDLFRECTLTLTLTLTRTRTRTRTLILPLILP
jgi:hypothetical protein